MALITSECAPADNEMGKHAEALKEWDAAVRAAPQCPFSRCKRGEQNLKLVRHRLRLVCFHRRRG